jgi:ubiquinone/menaquinone biosynthesis C-methylase UbiE
MTFRHPYAASGRRRLAFASALVLVLALAAPALRADDASEAQKLFELLELKPGMRIAEIGGGSGGMTVEMAKRLGPEGHVYSSELSADRRADIRAAATREHLTNITILESSDRTANLPDGCCDAIFMRNVYHHFTKPDEMDRSLVAALKPGGRIGVIDFIPDAGSKLPDGVPENRGGHGVPPDVVIEELSTVGMTSAGPRVGWPNTEKTGPNDHGFLVLLRKPSS